MAKRLFDPFTTKASGTGLGLSIAARIIEKHGGTLEHTAELNRGTRFRIMVPIAPAGALDASGSSGFRPAKFCLHRSYP